jgi:hypothetical protein
MAYKRMSFGRAVLWTGSILIEIGSRPSETTSSSLPPRFAISPTPSAANPAKKS